MKEYKKSQKILLLAMIFFFSGLLFFYFRMSPAEKSEKLFENQQIYNMKVEKKEEERQVILKNMPEPTIFKEFIYKGEESVTVDLECKKEYATVIIYQRKTDYRYDPLGAKYNTAFPCEGRQKFSEKISLKSVNLENGLEYYLVRAHQGNLGGWDNPY